VKTQATQLGQTYTGVNTTLLNTAEPAISWSTGTTTINTQGPVSFYVDTSVPGAGIVLTSYSKSQTTCWYAVDNLTPITSNNGPYAGVAAGSATSAPTAAGTYYSKVTGVSSCNAAAAQTAFAAWQSSFSAVA